MKEIKFNKTQCGVDFLLNVIEVTKADRYELDEDLHKADFFQIVFVNHGKGSLQLDDQEITN